MARIPTLLNLKFNYASVEAGFPKLLPELFPRALELLQVVIAVRTFIQLPGPRKQQVKHSFFRVLLSFVGDLSYLLLAHQVNGYLDQVPYHRFDVTADIANLGKL